MKRCSGINLYAKIENPNGHRIERLFFEGKPVARDRHYRAAYVIAQGVPAKFGRNRRNLDIRAIEAMRRYLAAHGSADPTQTGSITAI